MSVAAERSEHISTRSPGLAMWTMKVQTWTWLPAVMRARTV
jgi:hypothetical protein